MLPGWPLTSIEQDTQYVQSIHVHGADASLWTLLYNRHGDSVEIGMEHIISFQANNRQQTIIQLQDSIHSLGLLQQPLLDNI